MKKITIRKKYLDEDQQIVQGLRFYFTPATIGLVGILGIFTIGFFVAHGILLLIS